MMKLRSVFSAFLLLASLGSFSIGSVDAIELGSGGGGGVPGLGSVSGIDDRYALFDGATTLEAGLLSDDGTNVTLTSGSFVFPSENDATTPTICFGVPCDSGIYETADNHLILALAGGAEIELDSGSFRGDSLSTPFALRLANSSATVPVFVFGNDIDTGMGRAAADTPALIGAGVPLAVFGTTIPITNAELKALRATPVTLVAAQGVNTIIELKTAIIILDFGSEVFTESTDNLVIQYNGGTDTSAAIEATGFIDSAADDTIYVVNSLTTGQDMTALINDSIELFNTGSGEYGGNASNDTTMTVKITYQVSSTGL